MSFAFHSYYLLVHASHWFFFLFDIFTCRLERNDNFYPLSGFPVPQHIILLCWSSHSADNYKGWGLLWAEKTVRVPKILQVTKEVARGQTCTSCTCRAGACEAVPALPSPARWSQHVHGSCSPCSHHSGFGSPLGLCLHFLPSSKVCPMRSAAAKLVQDSQCVRLSCAQTPQAECHLWGFYIYRCIHRHIHMHTATGN